MDCALCMHACIGLQKLTFRDDRGGLRPVLIALFFWCNEVLVRG